MILLISDLHLQEERPDITRAFLRFLQEKAAQAEALYILGDFFESWIGDNGMTPFHLGIATALHRLSEQGTAIYLMHGNRDFLLGKRFCQLAGCTLLPDPYPLSLAGHRVLLSHGDRLCTRDIGYQRLRLWLRNPVAIFLLSRLPIALKRRLARWLRNKSKSDTQYKAAAITDITPEAVPPLLARYQATTLIHGHTHRPGRHPVLLSDGSNGNRIVLGDWEKNAWYLKAEGNALDLIAFPIA